MIYFTAWQGSSPQLTEGLDLCLTMNSIKLFNLMKAIATLLESSLTGCLLHLLCQVAQDFCAIILLCEESELNLVLWSYSRIF